MQVITNFYAENTIITTQNALVTGTGKQRIENGDRIFVRVLANGANQNSYEVSFLGTRTHLYSEIPLQVGQSFRATVAIENGKLLLHPEIESAVATNDESGIKKLKAEDIKNNEKIQTLLKNFGLENSESSFNLIQMLVQNKVKINPEKIRHSQSTGKRISKKNPELDEKIASETALEFKLKGMDDDEDAVLELTKYFHGEKQDKKENPKKDTLTAFNHLKTRGSDIHTILIPFEYENNDGIAILEMDTFKHELQRFLMKFENEKGTFFFNVQPKEKKIEFFIEYFNSNLENEPIISMLQKDFPDFFIEINVDLQNHFFSSSEGIDFISESV